MLRALIILFLIFFYKIVQLIKFILPAAKHGI